MAEAATDLMTVQQVAERLNCSQSQVYGLIYSRELEHVAIGKRGKRIERAEVERYIEAHRRRGPIEQRSSHRWELQSDIANRGTNGLSPKRATVSDLKRRLLQSEKQDSSQPKRKAS